MRHTCRRCRNEGDVAAPLAPGKHTIVYEFIPDSAKPVLNAFARTINWVLIDVK